MKKMKVRSWKRIRAVFCMLAMVLCMTVPMQVKAASAEASVSVSQTEVKQGDTVDVSVVIKADTTLGPVGYTLQYDGSMFQLPDKYKDIFPAGKITWKSGAVGYSTYKETFTMTALKDGTCTFTLSDVTATDENEQALDGINIANPSSSVTVSAAAASSESQAESSQTESSQESNESQQETESASEESISCRLSTLEVEPGSITFDPSVKEYTVHVANDVTKIAVHAATESDKATYVVEGMDNLQEGENLVTVHVTADDGGFQEYTIHVIRAASGEQPSETESLSVDGVEGFDWTVEARQFHVTTFPGGISIPKSYVYTTVKIGEYEVPAYTSDEHEGLYLIYAGENGGDPGLCWFRESDGVIFPYVQTGAVLSGAGDALLYMIIGGVIIVILLAINIILAHRVHHRKRQIRELQASSDRRQRDRNASEDTYESYEESEDEEEDEDSWMTEDEDDSASEEDTYEDVMEDNEDEDDDKDSEEEVFGVDIQVMEEGIEREVSRYGSKTASIPASEVKRARSARPEKPTVNRSRVSDMTTRVDADRVKKNREK